MNEPAVEWFYMEGRDKRGPKTTRQMRELLVAGSIPNTTLVFHEGMKDWIRAYLAPELQAQPIPGFTTKSGSTDSTPFLQRVPKARFRLGVVIIALLFVSGVILGFRALKDSRSQMASGQQVDNQVKAKPENATVPGEGLRSNAQPDIGSASRQTNEQTNALHTNDLAAHKAPVAALYPRRHAGPMPVENLRRHFR